MLPTYLPVSFLLTLHAADYQKATDGRRRRFGGHATDEHERQQKDDVAAVRTSCYHLGINSAASREALPCASAAETEAFIRTTSR